MNLILKSNFDLVNKGYDENDNSKIIIIVVVRTIIIITMPNFLNILIVYKNFITFL